MQPQFQQRMTFGALWVAGLVVLASWSLPTNASAAIITTGIASVDGSQEVPDATGSAATGVAILEVNETDKTFGMDLVVSGINAADLLGVGPNSSPIHIHSAPAGMNGGIVIDLGYLVDQSLATLTPLGTFGFQLTVPAGTAFGGDQGGVSSSVDDNLADFLVDGLYINIHTTSFGGGEIRGQIDAIVPEPGSLALAALAMIAGGCVLARRR